MTSHREMKDLAGNPAAIRALATYLLALRGATPPIEWTEWEVDFLDSMATRDTPEPLTMRQREILAELRNSAERCSKLDGFSVETLVESCWMVRDDLSVEEDADFIARLREAGLRELTRRQLGRVLKCCRELGVIEPHHGFSG